MWRQMDARVKLRAFSAKSWGGACLALCTILHSGCQGSTSTPLVTVSPSPAQTATSSPTPTPLPQHLYVANDAGYVSVYAANPSADETPLATISSDLIRPRGVALDSAANIYVADRAAVNVKIYAAHPGGNEPPLVTLASRMVDPT